MLSGDTTQRGADREEECENVMGPGYEGLGTNVQGKDISRMS